MSYTQKSYFLKQTFWEVFFRAEISDLKSDRFGLRGKRWNNLLFLDDIRNISESSRIFSVIFLALLSNQKSVPNIMKIYHFISSLIKKSALALVFTWLIPCSTQHKVVCIYFTSTSFVCHFLVYSCCYNALPMCIFKVSVSMWKKKNVCFIVKPEGERSISTS